MDDQSLSPAPSSVANEDLDEPVEGCTSSPVPQEHRVEGRAFSSPVPQEHRVEGRAFSSPVSQEHRVDGRAFSSPVPQEHRVDGRAFSSPVPQEHWVVPGPSRRLSVRGPRILLPGPPGAPRRWPRILLPGPTGALGRPRSLTKAVCYSLCCALWKQLTPQVVVTRPMSDLCWMCQQISTLIMRAHNQPVEEKSEVNIIHVHYFI